MKKNDIKLGCVYKIKHLRKGNFIIRVSEIYSNKFIKGVLLNGNPYMLNSDNEIDINDEITLSLELITVIEEFKPTK